MKSTINSWSLTFGFTLYFVRSGTVHYADGGQHFIVQEELEGTDRWFLWSRLLVRIGSDHVGSVSHDFGQGVLEPFMTVSPPIDRHREGSELRLSQHQFLTTGCCSLFHNHPASSSAIPCRELEVSFHTLPKRSQFLLLRTS